MRGSEELASGEDTEVIQWALRVLPVVFGASLRTGGWPG